jgi:hypothetical protein
MDLIIEENKFEELRIKLNDFFSQIEHTADNFAELLIKAMEEVEIWAKDMKGKIVIHGIQKKEIVVALLQTFADKFEEGKDLFILQVDFIMDKLIDIFVAAARGQLNLAIEISKSCCCVRAPSNKNKGKRILYKDVSEIDAITEDVLQQVKAAIAGRHFTANTFISLVTLVMQFVEKSLNATGPEKKQVAMNVIGKLVQEIPMEDSHREIVLTIVNTTLPKIIDFIISAANGEFDFSKVATMWKSMFPCCFKAQ